MRAYAAQAVEADRAARGVPDEMDAVAAQYAHKLALDLECVLADYSGTWWDAAIKTIGDYRSAMNAIHERESPTFMGEPVIEAAPQPAAQPIGEIVVTKNEDGRIVAVTRQDEDGKILEVIATSIEFERKPMTVYQMMEYVPQGSADAGTVSGIVAAVEKFHGIKGTP